MSWDLILVGGGLANGLLASAFQHRHPDLRILILEAEDRIGGNHTWCWHESDLPQAPQWLDRLTEKRWSGYTVKFDTYTREMNGNYCGTRSEFFAAAMPPSGANFEIRTSARVKQVYPQGVTLTSGDTLEGTWVIDGRGRWPSDPSGFQKFVGLYVQLESPHGLLKPILMDAKLEQFDDFRFLYTLPWSADTLLIEDTMYSNHEHMNLEQVEQRIRDYCDSQGWVIKKILSSESAALPIPLLGRNNTTLPHPVIGSGIQAGMFHATTGYSFPQAVTYAEELSRLWPSSQETAASYAHSLATAMAREQCFFKRLNNMMFEAGSGCERYKIFQRFYRLGESTIQRFYRGKLNNLDKFRLLCGRPPVPLWAGIKAFFTRYSATSSHGISTNESAATSEGLHG